MLSMRRWKRKQHNSLNRGQPSTFWGLHGIASVSTRSTQCKRMYNARPSTNGTADFSFKKWYWALRWLPMTQSGWTTCPRSLIFHLNKAHWKSISKYSRRVSSWVASTESSSRERSCSTAITPIESVSLACSFLNTRSSKSQRFEAE